MLNDARPQTSDCFMDKWNKPTSGGPVLDKHSIANNSRFEWKIASIYLKKAWSQ